MYIWNIARASINLKSFYPSLGVNWKIPVYLQCLSPLCSVYTIIYGKITGIYRKWNCQWHKWKKSIESKPWPLLHKYSISLGVVVVKLSTIGDFFGPTGCSKLATIRRWLSCTVTTIYRFDRIILCTAIRINFHSQKILR